VQIRQERPLPAADVEGVGGDASVRVEAERRIEIEVDGELAADAVIDQPVAAAYDALAVAAEQAAEEVVAEVGRPSDGDRRREVIPILIIVAAPVVLLAGEIDRDQFVQRDAVVGARDAPREEV